MSATDSVIGSANSSEDSVVIVKETVRTNRPPTRICAAQAGLSYDEVRTMRPYLGDTIMNSLGNLEVPFFTSPAHHILSRNLENMSTNYTSHVMSTPITLSGQGI